MGMKEQRNIEKIEMKRKIMDATVEIIDFLHLCFFHIVSQAVIYSSAFSV